MFATGICVSSDLHTLVDLDSNDWLNRPGNDLIEPHVSDWTGHFDT